jgi:hypothetical protein
MYRPGEVTTRSPHCRVLPDLRIVVAEEPFRQRWQSATGRIARSYAGPVAWPPGWTS